MPSLSELYDREQAKIISEGTGYLDTDVARDLLESNIGRVTGKPLGEAATMAAKSTATGVGRMLGAVGSDAAHAAGKLVPRGVKRRATGNVPYDFNRVKDRAALFKDLGVAKEDMPASLQSQLRRAPLFPGSKYLGFGLAHALPAAAATAAETKGSYKRLSNAAQGVREVTANYKSIIDRYESVLTKQANPGNQADTHARGGSVARSGFGKAFMRGASDVAGNVVSDLVSPTLRSYGGRVQRHFIPSSFERAGGADAMMESGLKEFGKQTGSAGAMLMNGILNNSINAGRDAMVNGPVRKKIFDALMMSDPVISRADPEMVLEAYHTMKKFAPTLSTDPNAARAFLREAVVHEGSLNFTTLGALAKAETEAQRALGNI